MDRLKALLLLSECTGDDIWSIEYCQQRGVPEAWVEEAADCFESGFDRDSETIYAPDVSAGEFRVTNQYAGVRDVDLAWRLGKWLGLDVEDLKQRSISRSHFVRLAQEAIEEE